MEALDRIAYWTYEAQKELNCFRDVEATISKVTALHNVHLLEFIELEDKGVVAFLITDDFRGKKICSELFFYIKPEYRGSIKAFKKLLNLMEERAKETSCDYVTFGSNIGYRDEKLLSLLSRFGYRVDTLKKEIK